MEIGTAFFYGALITGVFVLGRLVEKKFFSTSTANTTPQIIAKKIGALGGANETELLGSLLKQLNNIADTNKTPNREIKLDADFVKRFTDLEQKSATLSRAMVLFRRKSDDLWMDVRDKYKLNKVEHLQVSDDYTKIKVFE